MFRALITIASLSATVSLLAAQEDLRDQNGMNLQLETFVTKKDKWKFELDTQYSVQSQKDTIAAYQTIQIGSDSIIDIPSLLGV